MVRVDGKVRLTNESDRLCMSTFSLVKSSFEIYLVHNTFFGTCCALKSSSNKLLLGLLDLWCLENLASQDWFVINPIFLDFFFN